MSDSIVLANNQNINVSDNIVLANNQNIDVSDSIVLANNQNIDVSDSIVLANNQNIDVSDSIVLANNQNKSSAKSKFSLLLNNCGSKTGVSGGFGTCIKYLTAKLSFELYE